MFTKKTLGINMIRLCNREGSYAEFLVYIAKPLQNINTVLLFMQGRVFASPVRFLALLS